MSVWTGTVLGMAFNAWRMTSMAWQLYIERMDPNMLRLYQDELVKLNQCVTALSD